MFLLISSKDLAKVLAILHQPLCLETTMPRPTSCQQLNQQVMEGSGKTNSLYIYTVALKWKSEIYAVM